MEQKWPQTLWLARHGQSAGNVLRDQAQAAGLPTIDIATRDVDTPLSPLGERQSDALGAWFAAMPAACQPEIVLCSPYVRASETARRLIAALDRPELACVADERLREKEFGILDRLTPVGIRLKFPELAEQRKRLGKFYFRPPGGESWCDVILRLRSFIEMLTREYRGERVLVVGHQVTVNCLRYLLERMDEAQILAIDRRADVPNCSITSYAYDATRGRRGKLVLEQENFIAPLRAAGAAVTTEADATAAGQP